MTPHDRAVPRIGVLAWALVGGAALHLALWVAINWYRVFGPYLILRLEDAASILTGMAPFLLGAAILVGAARWPAGRRWLVTGAALSAVHGVMQSGNAVWWAWWQASDPFAPEGPLQGALITASLVQVVAGALVPVCLAMGLARARRPGATPMVAWLAATATGVFVLVGGLGLLARELVAASEIGEPATGYVVLGLLHRLLGIVGGLGLAALALAALRGMPSPLSHRIPELLIGAGAILAAAGSGATWIGQAFVSLEAQSTHLVWVWTIPWTATVIGLMLVIAGFAIAALQPQPGHVVPDPDRPGTLRAT